MTDLVFWILIRAPLMLPLLYVLTILLRVACYFSGAEIPAFGRAFFTASSTAVLSAFAAVFFAAVLDADDTTSIGVLALVLAFVFALGVNMAIAVVAYRFLLGLRLRRALTVWSIQAGSFIAFGTAAGCLMGVGWSLLFD